VLDSHLTRLEAALRGFERHIPRLDAWGVTAARKLMGGSRLLACGNGGSAEQAQHLTAELVGRYEEDRAPLAALALTSDMAAVTAIGNDYGAEEVFARQVRAHGRPGDVLMVLSTSGRSRNLIAAVDAARQGGITAWALTGPRPNPLADMSFDAICIDAPSTATVQEVHLVVIHMLCAGIEVEVGASLPYDAEVH